ncbi:MAG: hypothetical protein M3Y24_01435 [Acidobacteriota bacterium]|nr:hypothetical protein [Acidobacteriota bacterium]
MTVPVTITLVAGLALAASCYPRMATNNLLFAMPLLLCVLFLVGSDLAKPTTWRVMLFSITALSLGSVFIALTNRSENVSVATRVGTVQATPRESRNIEFATSVINPGATLFVFPYQPIWYSLTGAINPTRYDFLQPDMMTLDNEAEALKELVADPPQWVIWHNLPTRTILAIWPHSDPATLHFRRIEQFIRTRYSQVQPADRSFRYAIAIFHRIG